MKKILVWCVCMLAVVACKNGAKDANDLALNHTIDSLNRVNYQKDSEISDMLETLNVIQEGFKAINEAEGRVTVERTGDGANNETKIRENVQFIQSKLAENRELINKLRIRLREGSIASEQLKKTVESLSEQLQSKTAELEELRKELAEKDIHIAELDEKVSNLADNVSTLAEDNKHKQETITTQDKELNTAWFVFGTKKELKEQNILKKGEVLQGNFNKNYFTKIDIRVDKEIKLMSRDAKLLTNHPAGTYNLLRDANKQYVLRITDPQRFWSTSMYLVVQVK